MKKIFIPVVVIFLLTSCIKQEKKMIEENKKNLDAGLLREIDELDDGLTA